MQTAPANRQFNISASDVEGTTGTISAGTGTPGVYAPLSGQFKYVDDYVTTGCCGVGGGTDEGQVLAFDQNIAPGDDPSGYDFNSSFMQISASKTANFSASVQADQPQAADDTQAPASFLLTRAGDVSMAGTITFHMTDDSSGSNYAISLASGDTGTLTSSSGEYTYVMPAGQANTQIMLTPGSGATWTGTTTMTIDTAADSGGSDDVGDAAANQYVPPTTYSPAPTPFGNDEVYITATAPAPHAMASVGVNEVTGRIYLMKVSPASTQGITFSPDNKTIYVPHGGAGKISIQIQVTEDANPATELRVSFAREGSGTGANPTCGNAVDNKVELPVASDVANATIDTTNLPDGTWDITIWDYTDPSGNAVQTNLKLVVGTI